MERQCQRCHTYFDDETHLSICPHHLGEAITVTPQNPLMDTIDELIGWELEELSAMTGLPSFWHRSSYREIFGSDPAKES